MTACSPAEWEMVSTRVGGRCFPVAADVMSRWRRSGKAGSFSPPRPTPGDARLLVISPHPDDAALSVGGLLNVADGWERHVGTLIGRSGYVWNPAPGSVDVEEVSACRQEEERDFAAAVGATLHQGTALDAPLREPAAGPFHEPGSRHVAEFKGTVDGWMREIRPHLVLAPLGIGGHADHRAARLAAFAAAYDHGVDLLLYEDLPYAAERGGQPPPEFTQGWTRRLVPIGEALPRKAACLAVYASQFELGPMQRLVAEHAWTGRTWVERLWSSAEAPPRSDAARAFGLVGVDGVRG